MSAQTHAAPDYAEHVSHDMLTYPAPAASFPDAWHQMGAPIQDHTGTVYYPVRGIDGREYVAEGVSPGAWRIVHAGDYGLGAVTRRDTLKGAVQALNAFHVANTCDWCGHVHAYQVHGCEACGRIIYALRYARD